MDIVDSIKKRMPAIQLEHISDIFQRNTHSFINRVRATVENRRERVTRSRMELSKNYYSRPPINKQTLSKTEANDSVIAKHTTLMPQMPSESRRSPSSTNSTISYVTSIISLDDDCFSSETQDEIKIHKDSISGYQLKDNQIQLTINHEQKRNLLSVTIHRVNIKSLSSDIKHIFARVYVMPGKLQKQNSKSISIAKASKWEHEFTFKKLTIGQLEDCSIRVQIFSQNGILKMPVRLGRVSVHLRNANISDFKTTTLTLERDI